MLLFTLNQRMFVKLFFFVPFAATFTLRYGMLLHSYVRYEGL